MTPNGDGDEFHIGSGWAAPEPLASSTPDPAKPSCKPEESSPTPSGAAIKAILVGATGTGEQGHVACPDRAVRTRAVGDTCEARGGAAGGEGQRHAHGERPLRGLHRAGRPLGDQ